jgi:uncharacterized membrane protein
MVTPANYFSEDQQTAILNSIALAEKETSGEIRLHVESKCNGHVLDRAAKVFAELEMHKTQQRNGVLFYLALDDHRFAVIGDAGINAAVPGNFWDDIKIKMQIKFRSGNFLEGITEGILHAGEQLKLHFPYSDGDVNELSDKISFGV